MPRKFEDVPAVRKAVPVLLGAFGPSGSGKSYSSLRLATGMERVTGKPTFVIDSEAGRALHYAEMFKFRHVPFVAPFGPLDYLAAIEHCVKQGAGQIIVDSGSHVWEGQGGVLEMHEAELDRLAGNDFAKRERVKMLAWVRPKAELRRLINTLLQINCNFIFCFRAKEKMKVVKGKEPLALGYQPIVSDEFTFEMVMNLFLPPGGRGVPDFVPAEPGERAMVKIPEQFREMMRPYQGYTNSYGASAAPGSAAPRPLDEDLGEQLARWAAGDGAPQARQADDPKSLRAEIRSVLKAHGLNSEEAAADALQHAFGNRTWDTVAKMSADQLRVGLGLLKKNLEGIAALKEAPPMREPGEDPEEE